MNKCIAIELKQRWKLESNWCFVDLFGYVLPSVTFQSVAIILPTLIKFCSAC